LLRARQADAHGIKVINVEKIHAEFCP